MSNTEEEVAETYDLERKIEILQQEAANLELEIDVLQNFVGTSRKAVANTKAQAESVAVLKKADADMLPHLESASATLTKYEGEVKSQPNLEDDMDELGSDFRMLLKLQRRAEIDKCLDPMNEFFDLVVGDGGRWKFLEKKSLEEQVKQEELRVLVESAKKVRRGVRSGQLRGRKVFAAKVIHRMFKQKKANAQFSEVLVAKKALQKKLTKLDVKLDKLQKRLDRPKKKRIVAALVTAQPEPLTAPLTLAPVNLGLDNFKDPNECLPKTGPVKKPLPDTPRPAFKTTGSYAALLPKVLQMDKKSKSIKKKAMALKMSAVKLFVASKAGSNDPAPEPQQLVDAAPGQTPESSDPEPVDQELDEIMAEITEMTRAPVAKQPESTSTSKSKSIKKKAMALKMSAVKLFVATKTGSNDRAPDAQPIVEEAPGQTPESSNPEPVDQESEEILVEISEMTQAPVAKQPESTSTTSPVVAPRKSPRLAEKQANAQSKSPQQTPPDTKAQNIMESESVTPNGDPGSNGVENPTNDQDPTAEVSQETLPESQASASGHGENPTDEQEKEVSPAESQTLDSIQAMSPMMSPPTRDNFEFDSFLDDNSIVDVPQSKTSTPLPTKFDSTMGGSKASGAWDLGSNDSGKNLFGPAGSNAKGDTQNDSDFDFFGPGGGDEPNDFFGNSTDDNRTHHLSLF